MYKIYNDRKFKGDFDYFLSKYSKVILVYSICTNHKGGALAHGQINSNILILSIHFSMKHDKPIFERAPKKIQKNHPALHGSQQSWYLKWKTFI
jgi:hypothetical protein